MSIRLVFTSPLVILSLLVAHPGETQPLTAPVIEVPQEAPAAPAISRAWEPRSRHAAASLDPAVLSVTPAAVIDVPHDVALAHAIRAMAPNQIGVARRVARGQVELLREGRFPWTRLPSGGHVAVLHLVSASASALRIGLAVEQLPGNAQIWFFSLRDPQRVVFRTSADEIKLVLAKSRFGRAPGIDEPVLYWSPRIEGDQAGVGIWLPADSDPSEVQISVPMLSHIVDTGAVALRVIPQPGDSATCNVDVSCDWNDAANAVAQLQFVRNGSTFNCSGTLLNDADSVSLRPYFLTANHCISDQAVASTVETWWFYETSSCNGDLKTPVPRYGGADLRFTTTLTDTTLLELDSVPPAGAAWAGWTTAAPALMDDGFGIHHPKADLKKISRGAITGFFTCTPIDGLMRCLADVDGNFFTVVWSSGTVEAGSSGSGLWRTDSNQLTASLSAGPVDEACPVLGVYGRFDRAYPLGLDQWIGPRTSDSPKYKVAVSTGNFDNDAASEFVVAELRGGSVILRFYDHTGAYMNGLLAPRRMQDVDIACGDYDGDGVDETAISQITDAGTLLIDVIEQAGNLIGQGSGGELSSLSIASGQLDGDAADEYVVGLVQSDGRVAAISFNLDGSRLGKVVALPGLQPSVDVGDFDSNPNDREYVLAYRSSESTLETAAFQGDGSTQIGRGTGGLCRDVTVAAGDFSQSRGGEEYAVSLIQSDGTLGMISFAADGTRLGKGVGGSTRNPRVAAGLFPQTAPSQGLVVSLLQADNLPASIAFSVTGTRLGKGIAPLQAVAVDVDTGDLDGDGYAEEVMAFTDQFGFARWAVFASDGTSLLRSD